MFSQTARHLKFRLLPILEMSRVVKTKRMSRRVRSSTQMADVAQTHFILWHFKMTVGSKKILNANKTFYCGINWTYPNNTCLFSI